MARWTHWVASVALLGGAWALVSAVPDDLHETDAFIAPISEDGWASTAHIAVAVNSVTETSTVTEPPRFTGRGRWIVVDVSAYAVKDAHDARSSMEVVMLTVGGATFSPTQKAATQPRDVSLLVDVPTRTSLAFEIPADLTVAHPRLEIWDAADYPSLDSLIAIDLDAPVLADSVDLVFGELEW